MKNNNEKTIAQRQAIIEKNYRRLFFLITICLLLFVAFAYQILQG